MTLIVYNTRFNLYQLIVEADSIAHIMFKMLMGQQHHNGRIIPVPLRFQRNFMPN